MTTVKTYSKRKTKSPLTIDSTSSDLFDQLLKKDDVNHPGKPTKAYSSTRQGSKVITKQGSKVTRDPFVPKESSPPLVSGSVMEVEKKEKEVSDLPKKRYQYSFSPRTQSKKDVTKRATTKIPAKAKLNVFDFGFDSEPEDSENCSQPRGGSKVKVQSSQPPVTKTSVNSNLRSDKSPSLGNRGNPKSKKHTNQSDHKALTRQKSGDASSANDQIDTCPPIPTTSQCIGTIEDKMAAGRSSIDKNKSESERVSPDVSQSSQTLPPKRVSKPKQTNSTKPTANKDSVSDVHKDKSPVKVITFFPARPVNTRRGKRPGEQVSTETDKKDKKKKTEQPVSIETMGGSKVKVQSSTDNDQVAEDTRATKRKRVTKNERFVSEIATRTRAGIKTSTNSPLDDLLESPLKKPRPDYEQEPLSDISMEDTLLTESPVSQLTHTTSGKATPTKSQKAKKTTNKEKLKSSSECVIKLDKSPDCPENVPSLKKSSSYTKPLHPTHTTLTVPSMSRSSSWPKQQYSLFSKQTDNTSKASGSGALVTRKYSLFNQTDGDKKQQEANSLKTQRNYSYTVRGGAGDSPRRGGVKGGASVSGGAGSSVRGGKTSDTVSEIKKGSQEATRVRNVRQAHECLEIGENQEFFDEVRYLLGSIKPSSPLKIRCLGTLNLAGQFLKPVFSQQLRAQGFTTKIIMFLKDCLEYPTLCLCTAVLFYIITRDKLNSDWTKEGIDVLVAMLPITSCTLNSDLSEKADKETEKIKQKTKAILEKVIDQQSAKEESHDNPLMAHDHAGGSQEEKDAKGQKSEPSEFQIDTDSFTISELSRETLLALSSPAHNPQYLRNQLRVTGALDTLANMVIDCSADLPGISHTPFSYSQDSSPLECDQGSEVKLDSVKTKLQVLDRNLKVLENCTLMNRDNQSYLVVFDGSVLISRLIRLIPCCYGLLSSKDHTPHASLLAVYKLLLNLTHDNELGCHRVGEQRNVMEGVVDCMLMLPDCLSDGEQFDIIVLALGLLINLTEHSSHNRRQLEATKVKGQQAVKDDKEIDELLTIQKDIGFHGNDSSLRALVGLFLKHYTKAESASIQVPSPQRLSQLSSSPHSSPYVSNSGNRGQGSSSARKNLTSTFANRLKSSRSPRKGTPQNSQNSQGSEGMDWLPSDKTEDPDRNNIESESEEEYESIPTDPMVFSREDFDTALHQAGRHLEDSVISSYTALLIGILVKHNNDCVDFVKDCLPSKTFSEMIGMMKKFVSFMNMTGSTTGLESIRHIIKYLEAL